MCRLLNRTGADDHIGPAFVDWLDQLSYVTRVILVVCVGIDDDVGSGANTPFQTRLERGGQTLITGQRDDVIYAVFSGDLDSSIGAAIINDQPLNRVDPN